jgi:tetratricopeptide (TPR) repeat protein
LTKSGTRAERAKAHYQLARSHYRKDEPKEALAELDAAERHDTATVSNLRALVLRGQVLEDLKRPKEAMAAYRIALVADPKSQDVLLSLVRLGLETKDEMSALDYLRRYTLLAERDVPGLLLAADAYLKMRRYDEAFEMALRAREITFHEKAQRILGLVHLHRGEDEKALFHLGKADVDSVVATGLLRAATNAGKLSELESAVEKASKVKEPTDSMKLAMEAGKKLLARRKQLDKVVTIPAEKAKEYGEALDALACAEEARSRGRAFEKLLAEALKLEVGPAYGLRARVELGRGRLAKALADAGKAIQLSPKDAGGYYVRGKVLEERGQGGLGDLAKAATLSGRADADVLLALSEALARVGKKDEAIAAAREALKLRPTDREAAEHLAGLGKQG